MEVGLLVPGVRPSSQSSLVEAITAGGYDSIWLRDIPLDITVIGERAIRGTGWDPFQLAAFLHPLIPSHVKIGMAVLRMDQRTPASTARALESLQLQLGSRRLVAGMGWSRLTDLQQELAFAAAVNELWDHLAGSTEYVPSGADLRAVDWGLATRRPAVWAELEGRAPVTFLTSVMHPKKLLEEVEGLEVASIILQADIELGDEPNSLELIGASLRCGTNRLAELGRAWQDVGVRQVIVNSGRVFTLAEHSAIVDSLKAAS